MCEQTRDLVYSPIISHLLLVSFLVRSQLWRGIIALITLSHALVLVQSFRLDLSSEEISLEEVGDLSKSVRGVDVRWNAEDLIEFLERLAFGLGNEAEHQAETDDVPDGVPRKRTLGFEGVK